MIDREARNKLAEVIRHYVSCHVNNFEFDETIDNIKSYDPIINFLRLELWFLYDDIRLHKNEGKHQIDKEDLDYLKRIILFLKSDSEYQWTEQPTTLFALFRPKKHKENIDQWESQGDIDVFPFLKKEDYERAIANPVYLNSIA